MHALSLASRFLITLVVSAVLPLLLYGWFSLRGMRDQIDEQVVRVFLPQLRQLLQQVLLFLRQRLHPSVQFLVL